MATRQSLQLKTIVLLVPIVLFASVGNVLLGKGMKEIGKLQALTPSALGDWLVGAFTNQWVWLGIASLLVFRVSFMVVLSWADYSFVSPAAAVSDGVAPLLSHWWLGEMVTPLRWMGVGIICIGVAMVSRTPDRTSE